MGLNKDYLQRKKLEALQKKADYNDNLKTPIRILIVNIVYDAKTNDKKLTIKDIQSIILEEVGDAFTESQIRHNISALIDAKVLILAPKADKNYIYLASEVTPTTTFMPASQNFLYSTLVILSVSSILFNYVVKPIPFLLTSSIYAIAFTFIMVSTQYLDYKLSITGYKQIILDYIQNKFLTFKQHPTILVYKERLQVLRLRFRISEIDDRGCVFFF